MRGLWARDGTKATSAQNALGQSAVDATSDEVANPRAALNRKEKNLFHSAYAVKKLRLLTAVGE